MLPDDFKIADTREWFRKAADDIRAAEALLPIRPTLYDEVAFHCQQSVEKSIKGFLFWHNESFQKTHDLNILGNKGSLIDSTLIPILQQAATLTQYAVEYRYPSSSMHPVGAEVEKMIDLSKMILNQILSRLPADFRP